MIGLLDAESDIGAAFSERIEGNIARVPAHQVAGWRAALGPSPNEVRAQSWLTTLLPHRKRAVAIHPGPWRAEQSSMKRRLRTSSRGGSPLRSFQHGRAPGEAGSGHGCMVIAQRG